MEVLNSIPIELDLEAVIKRIRLRNRSDNIVGHIREMLDIKSVREGAPDYLVKGKVDSNLLARTIRNAIERKLAEEGL